MMKKVALVAVTLAFAAAPAFAKSTPKTTSIKLHGTNDTTSVVVSNTGVNSSGGIFASVKTGKATTSSTTLTDMNDVTVKGGNSNVNVTGKGTNDTLNVVVSNSGFNKSSGGSVTTGDASAHSFVSASMNTVVVN